MSSDFTNIYNSIIAKAPDLNVDSPTVNIIRLYLLGTFPGADLCGDCGASVSILSITTTPPRLHDSDRYDVMMSAPRSHIRRRIAGLGRCGSGSSTHTPCSCANSSTRALPSRVSS